MKPHAKSEIGCPSEKKSAFSVYEFTSNRKKRMGINYPSFYWNISGINIQRGGSGVKKLFIVFMIGIIFVITACSGNESKQEVLEKALQSPDQVESYFADFGIDIDIKSDIANDSSTMNGQVTLIEDPIAIHQLFSSKQEGTETSTEIYRVQDEAFVKQGEGAWTEQPVTSEMANFEPDYETVVSVLENVEELVEFDNSGDTYQISYSGFDQSIYDAFEGPFSVQLTGFRVDEDVTLELVIDIHQQDHYIENLDYTIFAESGNNELEMNISLEYDQVNEIEDIEIPEEVQTGI